jgi:predicted dehydrogenase
MTLQMAARMKLPIAECLESGVEPMVIEGSSTNAFRRIRLGMVGGGRDAFIGGVHRIASRIDDRYELVAGCFSSTADKSKASGADLGVAEDRVYADFIQMAQREAQLKNGIEAVSIVTPNHVHFAAAKEFLKRGIHVICDKPLTSTLADAKKLVKAAESANALFILTHNYTGYPMVRQAREMVANGELGTIRLVHAEYPQDWLTEDPDIKQSQWRTDPARSGAGGSIGDIGTHAYNLACFVSGLELEALSADMQAFVSGRELDDNAHVMLRWKGGARGMLWSSQVAPGNENALKLRIYGTKGGLEWKQENPNYLWHSPFGEPRRLITRSGAGSGAAAGRVSRIPPGHPEGYLEGFANIYSEAAEAIRAHQSGKAPDKDVIYPTVRDGLKGVQFVDACVRSSARNAAWMTL